MCVMPFIVGSLWVSSFVSSPATVNFHQFLSRAAKKEMAAYGAAGALATEVLSSIRTVIAFNAQPFEINR